MLEGVLRFPRRISAHGGRETWRSAVKRKNDFPVHIDPRIVIVICFGRGHTEADKDCWGLEAVLRMSHVTDQDVILAVNELLLVVVGTRAVRDQHQRARGSVEHGLAERHRLEPCAVQAAWAKAHPLEFCGDVASGDLVTRRVGSAALQHTIGEEPHVPGDRFGTDHFDGRVGCGLIGRAELLRARRSAE